MKINLRSLVDFYDKKNPSDSSDASAITGMMGEELATTLFCDFIVRKLNGQVKEVRNQCTPGSNSGNRLDRWIHVEINDEDYRFQTEIKNWSSHSLGGKKYPNELEDLPQFRINRWEKDFDTSNKVFKKNACNKVLMPMKTEVDWTLKTVNPLMIFWDSLHPRGCNEEYFEVEVDSDRFSKLFVFSMSTYAHKLIDEKIYFIDVEMGMLKSRIHKISNIITSNISGDIACRSYDKNKF